MRATYAPRRGRSIADGPVRAAALFLRSRQAWQPLLWFVLVTMVATAFAHRYDDQWLAQTISLVLAPMLAACLIGGGAGSPFGEPERTAALPLPLLRLGYLAGLLLLAATCLIGAHALVPWVNAPVASPDLWMATDGPEVAEILMRNLLALTGVALIGARLLGAGLAWIVPLGVGMLSLVASAQAVGRGGGASDVAGWALVVQPAGQGWAFAVAAVLAGVGLRWVAAAGASDAEGDEAA